MSTSKSGLVGALFLAVLWASLPVLAHDLTPNPPGDGVVVTPTGLVLPVREVGTGGFSVTTPCWNEGFVASGSHLSGVDVVLDPGHGGRDLGAVGPGGITEKDVNLQVALATAAHLRQWGYSVLLTRTTDLQMEVVVRAEIARALNPAVFVSIHHNSGATRRSVGPGTETYHQNENPNSVRLAGILYEEIHRALSAFDVTWRGSVYQGANGLIRSRDRRDYFGILRYTPGMASVLSEAAYMNTRVQAQALADPSVQAAQANALARGIVRYLTTDDPGSGYNGTVRTSRTSGHASCTDPSFEVANPEHLGNPTGPFGDVGDGVHQPAIKEIANGGTVNGTECGPNRFCPDAPIQRWVMAVWLLRVLNDWEPEPITSTRFQDVDPQRWWAPYVERLAALEITLGCDTQPARFCPHSTVTRDQMASFLVRAFKPPIGVPTGFTDTAGSLHAPDIDALSAAGIIQGCDLSPARFCPHQVTTRAEAASLLMRALHAT